jgi:hypothetical protein
MPHVTISRVVAPDEAARALRERLGASYSVTEYPGRNILSVRQGTLASATVRLVKEGDATTFRVHGSGLIIGRIMNEFGIARTVATAIRDSVGAAWTS